MDGVCCVVRGADANAFTSARGEEGPHFDSLCTHLHVLVHSDHKPVEGVVFDPSKMDASRNVEFIKK
jgi:hypothetical protein